MNWMKINSAGYPHFTKLTKPKKSSVYDIYWQFAAKRFDIFVKRLTDIYGPWTNDPVIAGNRFTNVFRASDRVSQYLIKLQYEHETNSQEVFFRTMLFKLFNKIETYEILLKRLGTVSYNDFSFSGFDNILTHELAKGNTIYSGAYIMPSAGSAFGYKFKHSNHLALLSKMMDNKLYEKIQESTSLENVFQLLLGYPSLGNFLAFQYTIDLNYSGLINFSEMDFVVAGPGAKNGIAKCFWSLGDYSFEDVIKMMADDQEKECERLGLEQPNLWGRALQLIDCQNLFCEVDKYLRVTNPEVGGSSGRKRIKQKFTKSKGPISLFFPPKWSINEKIDIICQQTTIGGIFL
ncbi:MAG: nucleotide kinase domain-containing protein [Ferruginibacter sp.]